MDCDNERKLLKHFPFYKLMELRHNYRDIRAAAKHIRTYVNLKTFYTNVNKCFDYSYNFVTTYYASIMEYDKADANDTKLALLEILEDMIKGLTRFDYRINSDHINHIVTILNLAINGKNQNHTIIIADILINLLEIPNINHAAKVPLEKLVKSVSIQTSQNHRTKLLCLSEVLLRRTDLNCNVAPIIKCIHDFTKLCLNSNTNNIPALTELLKCLNAIYKYHSSHTKNVTEMIKHCLHHFCLFMDNSLLRPLTEELLVFVLRTTYFMPIFWSTNLDKIMLQDLKSLPSDYKKWPETGNKIYFIIVYELFFNSVVLWNAETILTSVKSFVKKNRVLSNTLLKAILLLYPLTLPINDSHIDHFIHTKILVNALESSAFKGSLITVEPPQMHWLLKSTKDKLLAIILMHYLKTESADFDKLMKAIIASQTGRMVVKLLAVCQEESLFQKISLLLEKLPKDEKMKEALYMILPKVWHRPVVFGVILKSEPLIPNDELEIMQLIKATSSTLPYLTNNSVFMAACLYECQLLKKSKNVSQALSFLYHYETTVKYIVSKAYDEDEATAVTALTFLRRVVVTQIRTNVRTPYTQIIYFEKLLKGSDEKIIMVLKLLQTLLSGFELTFNVCLEDLPVLHYIVHSLLKKKVLPFMCIKTLRSMYKLHSSLAYSQVCFLGIENIWIIYIESKCTDVLNYIKEWYLLITRLGNYAQEYNVQLIMKQLSIL